MEQTRRVLGSQRVKACSRPEECLVLRGLKRAADQKGAWFSEG